ncbi:succinate dehydrogenase assembly factor 2 [soil metagenome]
MTETNLSPRRKRILWRAMHRGMKEMDLLLGGFAVRRLPSLTESELDELEAVIDLPDPELLSWIKGETPVPAPLDTPTLRAVLAFRP